MICRPKNLPLFLMFRWRAAAPAPAAAIQVKTRAYGPLEDRVSYENPSLGLSGENPIVRIAQDNAVPREALGGQ